MTGRQCRAVDQAQRLVADGASIRKAAAQAGCAPSSVMRALQRARAAAKNNPGQSPA